MLSRIHRSTESKRSPAGVLSNIYSKTPGVDDGFGGPISRHRSFGLDPQYSTPFPSGKVIETPKGCRGQLLNGKLTRWAFYYTRNDVDDVDGVNRKYKFMYISRDAQAKRRTAVFNAVALLHQQELLSQKSLIAGLFDRVHISALPSV